MHLFMLNTQIQSILSQISVSTLSCDPWDGNNGPSNKGPSNLGKNSHFDCIANGPIYCPANKDCNIYCEQDIANQNRRRRTRILLNIDNEACAAVTINCPSNAICNIYCTYSCKGMTVNAQFSTELNIFSCGTISGACDNMIIHCPMYNGTATTETCIIGDSNSQTIDGLNIYAQEAFSDVDLSTIDLKAGSTSNIMHCGVTTNEHNCVINNNLNNRCFPPQAICTDYALTRLPTKNPSKAPTNIPSKTPSNNLSMSPTNKPTDNPSKIPTYNPSISPTNMSSKSPTVNPTESPYKTPTEIPSNNPSQVPTKTPIEAPTQIPTNIPSKYSTNNPSKSPTMNPTDTPSKTPTKIPTNNPSISPTKQPTNTPTNPSISPTNNPSFNPSAIPSKYPTNTPTTSPTEMGLQIINPETTTASSTTIALPTTVLPTTTAVNGEQNNEQQQTVDISLSISSLFIAGYVSGGVILLICCVLCVICYRKKQKQRYESDENQKRDKTDPTSSPFVHSAIPTQSFNNETDHLQTEMTLAEHSEQPQSSPIAIHSDHKIGNDIIMMENNHETAGFYNIGVDEFIITAITAKGDEGDGEKGDDGENDDADFYHREETVGFIGHDDEDDVDIENDNDDDIIDTAGFAADDSNYKTLQ